MNKKLSPGRRAYIYGMKALMYASTAAIGALVLFLIGYVLYRGIPNITWKFLTTAPSILNDTIGIWPDILNSIYVVIATIIIVLPLGACAISPSMVPSVTASVPSGNTAAMTQRNLALRALPSRPARRSMIAWFLIS